MATKKKLTKRNPDELNPKQLRFCHEYMIDHNGTQAAIRAGYSEKTANEQAGRLLANVSIQSVISKLEQEYAKKNEITVDWLIQKQKQVFDRCMEDEPVRDRDGNPIGVYQFDSTGANKALDQLAKMTGGYKEDNRQKAVNVLQQLNIASLPEHELDRIIMQMHSKVIAAETVKKGKK